MVKWNREWFKRRKVQTGVQERQQRNVSCCCDEEGKVGSQSRPAAARSTCAPHTDLGAVELLPRPQSAFVPIFLLSHPIINKTEFHRSVSVTLLPATVSSFHTPALWKSFFFSCSRNHTRTIPPQLGTRSRKARPGNCPWPKLPLSTPPTGRTEPSLLSTSPRCRLNPRSNPSIGPIPA